MKKRLDLALFYDLPFHPLYIFKDICMMPYFLAKSLKMRCDIYYLNKKPIDFALKKDQLSMIHIKRSLKIFHIDINFLLKLIKNAGKYRILVLFYLRITSFVYILFYKLLNPKGKVLLKLDVGQRNYENLQKFLKKKDLLNRIRSWMLQFILKKADIITVENPFYYKRIKNDYAGVNIADKLINLPNGIDDEFIDQNLSKKDFNEKENIFLTVGRIGSPEKNNEMMLEAIKNIDMKDWRFIFCGPVEEKFKSFIEDLFLKRPDLKEKVIFTGAIYNREELFQLYNRSKVFVLTSNIEAAPNVFPEAHFFGNFIISTPVGNATSFLDQSFKGCIIPKSDTAALTSIMKNIVSNKYDLKSNHEKILDYSHRKLSWNMIIKSNLQKIRELLYGF